MGTCLVSAVRPLLSCEAPGLTTPVIYLVNRSLLPVTVLVANSVRPT